MMLAQSCTISSIHHGYLIAQIFFGLFLFPRGYLVYRSGYFSTVLGIILMIGCGSYLADVVAIYLSLESSSSVSLTLGARSSVLRIP